MQPIRLPARAPGQTEGQDDNELEGWSYPLLTVSAALPAVPPATLLVVRGG